MPILFRSLMFVVAGAVLVLPTTANACRKGLTGRVATIEQAREVPAGLIAFTGSIVAADSGRLTIQVIERIQGVAADLQVVELDTCMGRWGKAGDTILVVAERNDDGSLQGVGDRVTWWRLRP